MQKHPAIFILCSVLLFAVGPAEAATVTLDKEGIHISAGTMGDFTLVFPVLENEKQETMHKLIGREVKGNVATLKYEGGAAIRIESSGAGELTLNFDGIPADVKNWTSKMMINFSYSQGGKWKIGNRDGAFPLEKPAKPFLFQGNAATFALTSNEGKSLTFDVPQYSFQQLADNRAWNWSIFEWMLIVSHEPDIKTAKITITGGGGDGNSKPVVLVDAIGQSAFAKAWPGKVMSAGELKADIAADKAWYDSLQPPPLDKSGGLPGSGAKLGLKATGFFHVEKPGEKWFLVDPEGNAFFHIGVCGAQVSDDYTLIRGREKTYEWLPPYEGEYKSAFLPQEKGAVFSFYCANLIRKYGAPVSPESVQARMIPRLRKWGFNSIGAFSTITKSVTDAGMPYVTSLPLDPWNAKIPRIPGINETWDPFDEKNIASMEKAFRAELPKRADDPLLIGYFLVNEPIYEDIPKVVPTLDGKYACKQQLVKMLADKYKDIAAFNKAWDMSAKSFTDLAATQLPVHTRAAADDMHTFTALFLDTYFQRVTDTFHKYDTHHMLIGNRLQPGTINDEQLCRISGKYMDVISFNYYTDAVDRDFLNRIHKWTGDKPMILSEFFWSAPRESGLAGGREVATQQERGLAYRNYVEQSAALGYIIGIEWFTLIDQAASGRWFEGFNGERANTGLVSVADRPWKPALAEMMKTNHDIYSVLLGTRPPFVFDNPRFTQSGDARRTAAIPRATGPITLDATTKNWPGIPPETITGKRLIEGSDAEGFGATFKLCWDDTNLYVLATITDPTPMKNTNAPRTAWAGDCIELFIGSEKPDQGGPLQFTDRHILLGAGGAKDQAYIANIEGAPAKTQCTLTVIPGVDAKSYTLEAAIPWAALAIKPAPGTTLLFDLAVDDSTDGHTRTRQLMWNGTPKNSADRTHWGRATLQQ